MSQVLPRLRSDLEFLPSPSPDHPGLFIRDPYHFSDAMMIIPPVLAQCLEFFNGQQTDLDLKAVLVRITGELDVSGIVHDMIRKLSEAGFLLDETFETMRYQRCREFAEKSVREPAHAGTAYPEEAPELTQTLQRYMAGEDGAAAPDGSLFAIAAPHVSPEGGWQSYGSAYRVLRPEHRERTFVILGTSHFGQPEKFGLTRKNFSTPFGEARTDRGMVDWLAERAPAAVEMEDFCHSFEHTIEFQVVFLQHLLGPDVRILPILCGAFAHGLYNGGHPESDDRVKAFLEALGELSDREGDRLFWVMGVDMAHMGSRYGDEFEALANQGVMHEVGVRDEARIDRIAAADAAGFWDLVRENRDDLKWCGSSPFYTFLKAAAPSRGQLLRYEQWNIDPQSVVSFAGMMFSR